MEVLDVVANARGDRVHGRDLRRPALHAVERGAETARLMHVINHRSRAMVRGYTRRADASVDHAGAGLL